MQGMDESDAIFPRYLGRDSVSGLSARRIPGFLPAPRMHAMAAPEPPTEEPAPALAWVSFRVVDDQSGEPIANAILDVTPPRGSQSRGVTDANGGITLRELRTGDCEASSSFEGRRRTETLEVVKIERGDEPVPIARVRPRSSRSYCLARIEPHKVRPGETLLQLAGAAGLTWQQLAFWNWGTSIPDEINRALHERVGCTRRRDGVNYSFDESDVPGIVWIPRPWLEQGLATNRCYTLRVRRVREFLVTLATERGLPLPEVEFEAELADGSRITRRLGRNGAHRLEDVPPGTVSVRFRDAEDIEAKSFAATLRRALADHDHALILEILKEPRETLERTIAAYARYFDDYRGEGLLHDIEMDVSDPGAAAQVDILLGLAGQRGGVPSADAAEEELAA